MFFFSNNAMIHSMNFWLMLQIVFHLITPFTSHKQILFTKYSNFLSLVNYYLY
jgi:hypothetical protein